jgi:CMP/dCMP kinase
MKLKKEIKLLISCDGGAASGKTTGAKLVSIKYGLKFLSSGMLYRLASYELLKKNPKNKIFFLKKLFKNLNLKKLNNINLHSAEVSENTSIIAKEKKIRLVLKSFQKRFSSKFNKVCIEGRDIGTIILPKADIKFFFKCNLNVAAKRRFRELKKTNRKISLSNVKQSLKIRNYRDISRKNSPLRIPKGAVIVDNSKLNKKQMLGKISKVIEEELLVKYGRNYKAR